MTTTPNTGGANEVGTAASAVPTPAPALLTDTLTVRNLVKHYGAVKAVDDVSMHCLPGEVLALVGENGAGKSTVAKMLAGAVSPTSGEITIGDRTVSVSNVSEARAIGIACAFQELALVPEWTVAENLQLPGGRSFRTFSQRKAVRAATETLQRLELDHIDASVPVSTLSLADRQMVEIARAISAKPQVLILDEATSSIDTRTERIVQDGMDKLMHGRTTFVIAHRLSTVRNSDCIMVLEQGRIIERGSHDELISKKGKYYQLYTGKTA